MSLELLNPKGATPEFVLTKALEAKPTKVIILMLMEDGQQHTLMSYMPTWDLAFLKVSLDAQIAKFFGDQMRTPQ